MKICNGCHQEKPFDQFGYRNYKNKKYLQAQCRDCRSQARRKWEAKNPQWKKSYQQAYYQRVGKNKHLLDKFGITFEKKEKMLLEQEGRCKICKRVFDSEFFMHLDHDHKTGKIRGILCSRCNQALGLLQDNPVILQEATNYLLTST